jgi:hypothetical protein
MKSAGYLLITLGFLAGSYIAVRDPSHVPMGPFLMALASGAAGVAMARAATHRAARSEGRLAAGLEVLSASLTRLLEGIESFDQEKASLDVYDLRRHIEEAFHGDIQAFVDARETIAHSFGLNAYAEVMSRFAAGERHLNRVWSASTDGYVDEAHAHITKALEQFRDARRVFDGLTPA